MPFAPTRSSKRQENCLPQQLHSKRPGGRAQRLIEARKRQVFPVREFEIGGILQRQAEAIGQSQRRAPRMNVGLRVDGNGQVRRIGEHRVAECRGDALAPNGHLQAVGDFQPPQPRHRRPVADEPGRTPPVCCRSSRRCKSRRGSPSYPVPGSTPTFIAIGLPLGPIERTQFIRRHARGYGGRPPGLPRGWTGSPRGPAGRPPCRGG